MNILEIKSELTKKIKEFFKSEFNFELKNINIELPELQFGDLTTNICLQESKNLNISPQELALKLKTYLENKKLDFVKSIEIKGPGFLNFSLTPDPSPRERGVVPTKYFGKKVLVEHSSPNLFKPFNIGHLMNNFTGEFIVRAMKEAGAEVTTISYPSDISLGIAKAVYEIKKHDGYKKNITKTDEENIKYFGESYIQGVKEYKNYEENKDEDKINEIKEVANNLYGTVISEDLDIYNWAKNINVKYLFSNLEKLGSHFDGFIFESESAIEGKKIVLENTGEDKIFQKSEGAIIYIPDESRKDINTAVFINSENNPTYLGKDIGLLSLKFKMYNPDFSFVAADNEQTPHFRTFIDAAGKIQKKWEENSFFIPHGRMTFKGKKMSSRLGGVPTAYEVINIVLEEVVEKSGEKMESMSEVEKGNLQREIAMSALRIAILRSKPGVNIDFDPEKSLSFLGDSGPYLCYTSARLHSLLEKGQSLISPFSRGEGDSQLERKIFQFPLILQTVIEEIAPQKLVTYLFGLTGLFNNFYANNKIIDENNLEETSRNLELVKNTLHVLKKALHILGIVAPEKM